DGSTLRVYGNGNLVGSFGGAFSGNAGSFVIGNRWNINKAINGLVDEVSLYSRSLSPAEIQAIYAAGTGGKCLNPAPPTATATSTLTPSPTATVTPTNMAVTPTLAPTSTPTSTPT